MIRTGEKIHLNHPSIPRESGDDPFSDLVLETFEGYSPRERG